MTDGGRLFERGIDVDRRSGRQRHRSFERGLDSEELERRDSANDETGSNDETRGGSCWFDRRKRGAARKSGGGADGGADGG